MLVFDDPLALSRLDESSVEERWHSAGEIVFVAGPRRTATAKNRPNHQRPKSHRP
jgi:hypothetical protein